VVRLNSPKKARTATPAGTRQEFDIGPLRTSYRSATAP
jgi:hypothetical protein